MNCSNVKKYYMNCTNVKKDYMDYSRTTVPANVMAPLPARGRWTTPALLCQANVMAPLPARGRTTASWSDYLREDAR